MYKKYWDTYQRLKWAQAEKQARVYASFDAMSLASAGMIAEKIREKADSLICLPAGNTAIAAFDYLIKLQQEGSVSFQKARFVQLDEWMNHDLGEENCGGFLNWHFYRPAGIGQEKVHLFDLQLSDTEEICKEMDEWLEKNGPIDIMMLGLGMNGHLGLNEPGVAWDQKSVVVPLSDTTKAVGQKYFSENHALEYGITLGMKHILAAKLVILQVGGKQKRYIVKDILAAGPNIQLPATALQLHRNAIIALDAEAASLL